MEEEWEWRVSDLIDWRTNCWDLKIVENKFQRANVDAILRIPLSHKQVTDEIFLLHTKSREYLVKSSYHTARLISRQEENKAGSSREEFGSSVWSKLWKLHMPNKIKVFGWRVCLDILPTRVNLARWRIFEDDSCEVCSLAKETRYHALWECGLAQDIWAGCSR